MDTITAFGIGALVFTFIVLLTAFSLKSTSIMVSAANKSYTDGTQESVDDVTDDLADDVVDDMDVLGKVSE